MIIPAKEHETMIAAIKATYEEVEREAVKLYHDGLITGSEMAKMILAGRERERVMLCDFDLMFKKEN